MKFTAMTLLNGTIKSQRKYDTNTLAQPAIQLCEQMLLRLRQGADFVVHGVASLPAFGVSLGAPEWLLEGMGEQVEAPGRFFTVSEPGKLAFQYNLVLPPGEITDVDDRAVATALGLSFAYGNLMAAKAELGSEEAIETRVRQITQQRPVLATALIPTYAINPEVVMLTSDFCTCFAAALFLEGEIK